MVRHYTKLLILILLTTCTKNTLFDDEVGDTDGLTISGKILLDKDSKPDNIYVWLGILNLGTYTDIAGNFKLELPHPESQPQKGISGEYPLYYYVANYKIDSSSVSLLNGKVIYNKSDINKDGEIRETIILKKLLTIYTSITPTSYSKDYYAYIQADLLLKSEFEQVSIRIFKYQRDMNWFTNIFFRNIDENTDDILFYRTSTLLREEEIEGERRLYMPIHTDSIRLETGTYEVIPYLKIIQENIPEGLMKSIGEDQVFVDSTFLTIPYKRQNAYLTVTPAVNNKLQD